MYWSWLQRVFIPGVFSSRWYNGQRDEQTIYIGNKHSLLVGMARVRQLRVKASKFFFHFYSSLLFIERLFTHTRHFTYYSYTYIILPDREAIGAQT